MRMLARRGKAAKLVGLAFAGLLALSSCSKTEKEEVAPAAPTSEEATDFVTGNLFFLALHELGHAMVSEFELPIAGREEDAVDRLATWMMTPVGEDESPDYLMHAADGWFTLAEATPLNEITWWDEHGTDNQRAFQIACLLYGSDPERYKDIAASIELPPERQETCAEEAAQNDIVWSQLLEPHLREDSSGKTASPVKVEYEQTSDYATAKKFLQQAEVLEQLRDVIANDYVFETKITLAAEECGESNAFWDPEARKITICYEIVEEYLAMV